MFITEIVYQKLPVLSAFLIKEDRVFYDFTAAVPFIFNKVEYPIVACSYSLKISWLAKENKWEMFCGKEVNTYMCFKLQNLDKEWYMNKDNAYIIILMLVIEFSEF